MNAVEAECSQMSWTLNYFLAIKFVLKSGLINTINSSSRTKSEVILSGSLRDGDGSGRI